MKILILCTGNSCRSQIAEGYLKQFLGDSAEVYSAGVETHGVNPRAIQIMADDNIDISNHTSNHIDEYAAIQFDHVITVCNSAKEKCPVFPSSAKQHHEDFPDPAKATGTEEEIMKSFETTRNIIKAYLKEFVKKELAIV